jgi:hypothetical protein
MELRNRKSGITKRSFAYSGTDEIKCRTEDGDGAGKVNMFPAFRRRDMNFCFGSQGLTQEFEFVWKSFAELSRWNVWNALQRNKNGTACFFYNFCFYLRLATFSSE